MTDKAALSSHSKQTSFMQAHWQLASWNDDNVAHIMRQHDLPEIIARLLDIRGVTLDQVDTFLNPTLARDFPDPMKMAGMQDMAVYMADQIITGRKIAVFGDFDVDGATSTSILVRFFRHCGLDVPFYIPDRVKEGYGPNLNALSVLKEQGAGIVIMVDCGIASHDIIQGGRDMGLDILVFDHHEAEDKLPPANHIVNPKRQDDDSSFDMLAACGVVFLACVAINTELKARGYYQDKGIEAAPLKDWLDIVALGTVCDMVPLKGPNRLFVKHGFLKMAHSPATGIQALCDVSGMKDPPTPYHAGFVIGPRINAGSRVHKADLGAQLLSIDDMGEATQIAWTLEDCNKKRKDIESDMINEAVAMVETDQLFTQPVIIVGSDKWHPGLSGLVAGRIKEKYDRPAAVITYAPGLDGLPEGRGSARSVPGVNIGASFIDARNKGLLLKGGGHAMAAGFTVHKDQEDAFKAYLTKHVEAQINGEIRVNECLIDAVLSVNGATVKLVKMVHDKFGPFGQGHDEPLFLMPNVRIYNARIVGKDHISAQIGDWEGGKRIKAIAFRAVDTPLGQEILKNSISQPFDITGVLNIDTWNDQENVQIQIRDAAYSIAHDNSVRSSD